jgi:2-dehydropantoate 2-reductase
MKIAIMGTGGVGGYFGARLAVAGENVWFVARGAHLSAIRRCGLHIESRLGDLEIKPAQATDDPAAIGPVDLVVFAVKLWDTEAAAVAAKPLVGADTAVLSLQNGVDAVERLSAVFGKARVIGGLCHIAAAICQPGVIRHTGTMARVTLGELDGSRSARLDAIAAACRKAGVETVVSDDIARAIWEKFVFLASFSGVTSLSRLPKGPIFADPECRKLFESAIAEAAAVARARGVRLPDDLVGKLMAFGDGLPAEMKSSMLGDLERGNRLELPWLSGAVAQLGAASGVPTPVHQAIYRALHPYAAGRATQVTPV